MTNKLSLLCTFLALTSRLAYGGYTIGDAIEDAKLSNSELKILEKQFDIKKLERYKAAAGFWPQAAASVSYNEIDLKPLDDRGNSVPNVRSINNSFTNNSIKFTQELFAGGGTLSKMKQAKGSVSSAESEYYSKKSDVILKVIDAHHGVILARRVYDISLNNEQAMRNRLEQIQTRFKAGELTRTDVSWAKYSLADAVAKKERAFGDMKVAEANFLYVIGKEPGVDLQYVAAYKIGVPGDFESFVNAVRKTNLDIKSAEWKLAAAKSYVSVTASSLLPNVTAQVSLDENMNPNGRNRGQTYSMQVSVPIISPANYISIKEAKYNARAMEDSLENTKGSVDSAVVQVWNQTQVAKAQKVSMKEAVAAARDALASVQQEYKIGTKTTLDLLDSEQRLYEMQINQEKVNKDLVISSFKMKALMGELYKFDFYSL